MSALIATELYTLKCLMVHFMLYELFSIIYLNYIYIYIYYIYIYIYTYSCMCVCKSTIIFSYTFCNFYSANTSHLLVELAKVIVSGILVILLLCETEVLNLYFIFRGVEGLFKTLGGFCVYV